MCWCAIGMRDDPRPGTGSVRSFNSTTNVLILTRVAMNLLKAAIALEVQARASQRREDTLAAQQTARALEELTISCDLLDAFAKARRKPVAALPQGRGRGKEYLLVKEGGGGFTRKMNPAADARPSRT